MRWIRLPLLWHTLLAKKQYLWWCSNTSPTLRSRTPEIFQKVRWLAAILIQILINSKDIPFQRLNFGEISEGVSLMPQSAPVSLDTPDVAIEFVLALEHPCMTHIQHPATMPSASSLQGNPTFHVQMASAPLISSAPRPPEPNTKWNWTASTIIIRQLLALSSSINLAGEITPVEAWNRVRHHPDFWRLDRTQIDGLRNELSEKVKCCGYILVQIFWIHENWRQRSFGAILDEQAFMDTLSKHLAGFYPPYPATRNQF